MFKILNEFKEFAVKGNMIDIAIGVIIGASFNKVVDALVKQVFMPPLSYLTNGVNFDNKKIILQDEVIENGVPIVEEIAIGYGKFIETSIDFFIVAMTVFIVVKLMNQLKKKAEDTDNMTVTTPKDIELLSRVTELLEEQNKLMANKKT